MGKSEEMEEKEEHWRATLRVMNERFKSRLDENVFEGVRDEIIYHGLRHSIATTVHKTFVDLCFCNETQEYLALDRGVEVQRYSMQGKQLQPSFALNDKLIFSRMLWCGGEAECLACYDPDQSNVWIMSPKFVSLRIVGLDFPTRVIYYVEASNEIVVVGAQQVIRYVLENLEDSKSNQEDLKVPKPLNYTDPEFGPSWQLECSALLLDQRQSASEPMLVASYATTLYVWLLALEEDQDKNEAVRFVSKVPQASKSNITAILFHDISSWIVIGDQHGNVVARESSQPEVVTMRVSGAHSGPVTRLLVHPTICGFVSYSPSSPTPNPSNEKSIRKREAETPQGGRLQVWSCNFRGPLEALDDLGQLCALVTNRSAASVVSLSPTKLIYLAVHQIYCFFAPLTSPAKMFSSTENMTYRKKVIVASEDNSVRVFSSRGSQLNVQILPRVDLEVVHALFAGHKNQLFTIILRSGEILVSDSSARPMKFRKVFVNDGPLLTCFVTYEYFDEIHDHNRRPKKPRVFYPTSTLIIVGTDEGNLILVNVDDGKRGDKCPAHEGSVVQLKSSVASKRIVSLGQDKCVKVWRVFADISQPLALYYTFYFIVPISHIGSMGHTLCVSKSSKYSQEHVVIMENMTDRVRLAHPETADHKESITEMITSETLHLCATSSLDKTVRIWDEENCLLKILEINICVEIMTFSSNDGDIIFGKVRHLYKIPHESYLPPKYRARIVADDLANEEEDDVVMEDPEYKIYDDVVDRETMLHPVISTPMASLDTTNADMPQVDLLIRKQICALYEVRDEDIRKIRDSLLKSLTKGKSGNRALMSAEEWKNHKNDLLKSMTRQAPQTPDYDFYRIQRAQSLEKKTYNERGIFFMLFGYASDGFDDPEYLKELAKDTKLPLNGFLPNSVLYKPKEKEKPVVVVRERVKREFMKYRYPPEFYPQEEDASQRRKSIRLSQLMGLDDTGEEEET